MADSGAPDTSVAVCDPVNPSVEELEGQVAYLEEENRRLKDRVRLLENDRRYAQDAVERMVAELTLLRKRLH